MGCSSLTPVESRKIVKQKTTGLVLLLMVQKSGEPVHMVNIPLFIWVLYIPGGDRRISSHQQYLPFTASKLLTPQMDAGNTPPKIIPAGTWKSPRFLKENHLNQTFMTLGAMSIDFQGCTQNGPTTNPGDLHHIKPPLSVCCSCSDFQKVCYPGRAAILSWWLKEARYLLWRYSRKPPKQLGCIVLKKRYVDHQEHDIYLFHGETSFINFHLPHCLF